VRKDFKCLHKCNDSIFIEYVSCFARGCFNGMYVTTCHSINIENSLRRYEHIVMCVFSGFLLSLQYRHHCGLWKPGIPKCSFLLENFQGSVPDRNGKN
jgi:hypothetical protein